MGSGLSLSYGNERPDPNHDHMAMKDLTPITLDPNHAPDQVWHDSIVSDRRYDGIAGVEKSLFQISRTLTQYVPRDNQLLNLLCPLEDIQDLGIPGELLQQVLLAVTQIIAKLDAAQRDLVAHPAGLGLGH